MANKPDLEYIMFPVNVLRGHQRVESIGRKTGEQRFRLTEFKKMRFTVGHAETKWCESSVGAKVMFQ